MYGEPIGYVWDGVVLCKECLEADGVVTTKDDEVGIVLDESESDIPEHCDDCHKFLGGSLTQEGYQQLCTAILEGHLSAWWQEEYLHHYSGWDWYIVPTFAGWRYPV